jgi:hypothetical protein
MRITRWLTSSVIGACVLAPLSAGPAQADEDNRWNTSFLGTSQTGFDAAAAAALTNLATSLRWSACQETLRERWITGADQYRVFHVEINAACTGRVSDLRVFTAVGGEEETALERARRQVAAERPPCHEVAWRTSIVSTGRSWPASRAQAEIAAVCALA